MKHPRSRLERTQHYAVTDGSSAEKADFGSTVLGLTMSNE